MTITADDGTLQEVAQIIGNEVRDTDLLGHTDKGTLALVLLDADFEHSQRVIDRLVTRIENYEFANVLRIAVGAACYPTHAVDAESLKRQALSRPIVSRRGGIRPPTAPELEPADPIAIMSAMLKPTLAVLVLLAVPGALFAQETETEKQAAREVLAKMAALEQSLDVPAMVARLTGPNAGARSGGGARQGADGQGAAGARRRHRHPPGNRLRGEAVGPEADGLPAEARLQRRDGHAAAWIPRSSRAIGATTARRASAIILEYDALRGTKGRVSRRSAQRAGAGRHRGGDRDGRVPDAHQHAGQRHRLRGARRGDDAAQRQDGDARGARVRRRGRHRAQPRRRARRRGPPPASAPAA